MATVTSAPRFNVERVDAPALVSPAASERYVSLDAYRGFIMMVLVSSGLGFGALKNDSTFAFLARQVDHVQWEGLVFWDLIQPMFMFMVGMAMPFAMAKRAGAGFSGQFQHVLLRALKLIFWSNLFTVVQSHKFQFGLINVLSQIAFGYVICFLLMQVSLRWQVIAAALILGGHWALFALFPGPQGAFSQTGNVGQVIDQWLLGRNYPGLYVTINFLSSAVTILFGVWAGYLMRSQRTMSEKLRILFGAAIGAMVLGMALTPFNPMVKRIWTASFTLFSAGLVVLFLIGFVWFVEVKGYKRAVWPMVVMGMNSIFVYCAWQLCGGSVRRSVAVFIENPILGATCTLAVFCYACYWLYRRNIFMKV